MLWRHGEDMDVGSADASRPHGQEDVIRGSNLRDWDLPHHEPTFALEHGGRHLARHGAVLLPGRWGPLGANHDLAVLTLRRLLDRLHPLGQGEAAGDDRREVDASGGHQLDYVRKVPIPGVPLRAKNLRGVGLEGFY